MFFIKAVKLRLFFENSGPEATNMAGRALPAATAGHKRPSISKNHGDFSKNQGVRIFCHDTLPVTEMMKIR